MIRVRIIRELEGPQVSYQAGQIINIADASGTNLINAGFAIKEPPTPSGVIATLYNNAGFIPVTPFASGYIAPGASGFISTVPSPAFYTPDDQTIVVIMPPKVETRLSILKLQPPLN